jgi:hypothetical protein
MSTLLGVGMNGVVQLASTAIANLKNASLSLKNDVIEELVCNGSLSPALIAAVGQHIEVKAEQLWTDTVVFTAAIAGATPVTIVLAPNGTGSGKPKLTVSQAIISQCDLKWDQKSAVSDSFSAKGILTLGTFT